MSAPFLSPRPALTVLAAALLLGACSTVDLGPRYDPPPLRSPQALPQTQTQPPNSLPADSSVAQPQPVPPSQPMAQPLPPAGTVTTIPPVADPANPNAHLVTLSTRMDGHSAMPPTQSPGTAQLDALYDSTTRVLRWKASWSGLSAPITGVQFHGPALDGQTAPPVMIWPAPFGPTYEGRATLNTQQATDLLNGRWYVNVFTSAYPAGELRGQLRVVH